MEINLFHVLGKGVVDALTSEERKQIDAISDRLSKDPNFKLDDDKLSDSFLKSRIDHLKAEAEEAQNYQSQMEKTFC